MMDPTAHHPRVPELLRMKRPAMLALLRAGHAIDPAWLEDAEYRGISLGLPAWVEALSWKTFRKAFHRDPRTGALRGWNVRIQQTGLDPPYQPLLHDGAPFTFGHFEVRPLEEYAAPYGITRGLMLDYGRGGNAPWDALRTMRDPLVALDAGSRTLLLGFSYVHLGLGRIRTPSFFCLQYDGPLTHRASPHGAPPP
ncbi:MAG: hypothetical protein HY904_17305 [Deltaproteobacteria bacterium]|nr:hypothetical protein [Deltaproteobacteria bacterium]